MRSITQEISVLAEPIEGKTVCQEYLAVEFEELNSELSELIGGCATQPSQWGKRQRVMVENGSHT